MNLKKLPYLLYALIIFSLMSCETGLGEALDLEAPEIKITTPATLSLVHTRVTLAGTCRDNHRVTEVIVAKRDSAGNEVYLGNAAISGEKWEMELVLEEGEIELVCTAKDAVNNSSTKSKAIVTLLVDDTAPEGLSWYLDRGNGIQVGLKPKEELETLDIGLAKNKSIPQNQKFLVYGHFYDAMSIDTITFSLKEDDNVVIQKTVTAEDKGDGHYIGEGKSIYAPVFSFTHDELVAAKASLGSGPHYLRASYYSTDDHKNSDERDLDYVLWYPESDIPGIQQSATEVVKDSVTGEILSETLTVNIGSAIPIHFFDDDELAEVAYDYLTRDDFTASGITRNNVPDKKDSFKFIYKDSAVAGKGDLPLQIDAGEVTGEFYIVAYVRDIGGEEKVRIIKTTVTDTSLPLLIIESPSENTVPPIKAGTVSSFEFKGYGYDTSGSRQIKIAYIPGTGAFDTASKREARAKELFKTATESSKTYENGEIVKVFVFPTPKVKGKPEDKWYIEPFSFEYDVLTDFGSEKNKSKFFEIMLEDTDGNIEYKQFNVSADSAAPEIKIKKPEDDMVVCDYRNEDLEIKFRAEKTSGLGIDTSEYKLERNGTSLVWTVGNGLTLDGDGFVSVIIPRDELKNWAEGYAGFTVDCQPVFKFYGGDVLGNKSNDQRTVVLSPLPVLESVTVDKISNTYPVGTVLSFQAKFTDSVKVTGSPRLKLAGIKNDVNNAECYAEFSTGTGTDTLTFKYTVKANDYTEPGSMVTCAGDSIDLNGGRIETGTVGTGDATIKFRENKNFWDATDETKKKIELDAIAPYIKKITASVADVSALENIYYVNENREVVLNVEFSEKVLIADNPTLSCGPDFKFKAVNDTVVQFFRIIEKNDTNGALKYNLASCFDSLELNMISDSAGNKLIAGKNEAVDLGVVIDTVIPAKPSVIGLIEGKRYNEHPEITVTWTGDDIYTKEYSYDGGLTWTAYNGKTAIYEAGRVDYNVMARVKDRAGNASPTSDGIKITINDTFPVVDEISIGNNDGKYPAEKRITFKLFLASNVEPFDAITDGNATAYIKFTNTLGTEERKVNITASSTATNKLFFEYIVKDTDDIKGIKITDVYLGKIQDKYNNQASVTTKQKIDSLLAKAPEDGGTCQRPNITLDGEAPYVVSYKLGGDTSYQYDETSHVSDSANTNFKITLKFNENIIKESGTIILQRKGTWAIPPVLTSADFLKWYNKMDAVNREKMMITEGKKGEGTEATDSLTGIPVGPYKKITHGLKNSGGKAVPDTDTKYVLAFDYGLYQDLSDSDKTVSNIRAALKSVGYDKHTIEVNKSKVSISGSNSSAGLTSDLLTIEFGETIEDGQEWELLLPGDAFHDETGNKFGGFKSVDDSDANKKTFSLWSNKVATPVVRVDRYSHGEGAKEPNASGVLTTISGYTSAEAKSGSGGRTTAPTGYVRARVDCETPGASIRYKLTNSGTVGIDGTGCSDKYYYNNNEEANPTSEGTNVDVMFTNDNNNNSYTITKIPDADFVSLNIADGDTTSTSNVTSIIIGDGRFNTSRKDYISALATLSGLTKSELGVEGAFKTTVYSFRDDSKQINIEGGTAKGGEPTVSGFPLRDATSDKRYSKNAYYNETDGHFAWVSYEIVSDWAYLQHRANYSTNYPQGKYGQLMYLYKFSTWE